MQKYRKYYYKIQKNLEKDKIFYKYYNETKTYKDAQIYGFKILKKIEQFQTKHQINIYTFSNKSFEMYASIFPILVSGAVWIPLSPNYPLDKIKRITDQIQPHILFEDIGNRKIVNLFKKKYKCKILNFKKINKVSFTKIDIKKKINKLNFKSTAFVYFTSGSSGEPKGIKISHKNIISDVFAQKKHLYLGIRKPLVFGDYYETSFSIFFDIYFPAIYFGSTLSPGITKNEVLLPQKHIEKNKVNTLVCVPSTIQRIKDYGKEKIRNIFEVLVLTGEPFYLDTLKFIFKNINYKRLFNCYGGTEMGNWVFFHKCKKNDIIKFKKYNLVPIGKNFTLVKPKIKRKELIVTGPMISNGYLNKNINRDKFIFRNDNTFFTSDYVIKYKGIHICIGRKDKMVKIRGYRVEIPEVEASIRRLKYVNQCIILHKKSKKYQNYLIAVISTLSKISGDVVRKDLTKFIPNYCIPKKIFFLNSLPLNNNGKIDRKKIGKKFI